MHYDVLMQFTSKVRTNSEVHKTVVGRSPRVGMDTFYTLVYTSQYLLPVNNHEMILYNIRLQIIISRGKSKK